MPIYHRPAMVGDWVGVYHHMWRGNRPLPRPAKVVAVGARVKVVLMDRDGTMSETYRLLQKHEVLAVFENKEEGVLLCAAASGLWEKIDLDIKELERKRNADVLATLRGVQSDA